MEYKLKYSGEEVEAILDTIYGLGLTSEQILAKLNSVDTKAAEEDLGNELFTLTNPDIILDMQRGYKLGKIIFMHIVFRRVAAPASTTIETIGRLNTHAAHNHSFIACGYNANTGNLVEESAVLRTDGDILVHFTKASATSNVTFDLCFFFVASQEE